MEKRVSLEVGSSPWLCPELNYSRLKDVVDAIIFDKDNTLTAPYENVIHPDASRGLENAVKEFGDSNVAIMSNSAGTLDDAEYQDAIQIEKELGIAVIRHNEKKPGGLPEVLQHFALDDASRICVVGDRLLTDIVFGNLHGMLTVHTLPLCRGKENKRDNTVSKIVRHWENSILYGNWAGGRWLRNKRPSHKYLSVDAASKLILNR